MAEQTLLDAISAAVDSSDGTTPPADTTPPAGETPDGDTDDTGASDETAAGDNGSADSGAGGADEQTDDASAAGKADDKGADAGKVPDAAGKPKAADEPKSDAEKAAEAAKAAGKKTDPLNDPFDNRWKKQTTERVQSLIDMVKQRDTSLEQANILFDSIADTGMSPEELAQMLGYANARHNGTPEQKQLAYKFLKEELRAVALELGETDSVDFLADHADLQAAVEANTITTEYAKEVALSRSRAARDTQTATSTAAHTAAVAAHNAGVQALSQLGTALVKRDGAAVYESKKAVLVATLKPVFAHLPAAQWAAMFQKAYDAMPKPVAAVPPAVPPVVPLKQQPLRPGTPAGGGGQKEPKSMKDAVFAAFEQAE